MGNGKILRRPHINATISAFFGFSRILSFFAEKYLHFDNFMVLLKVVSSQEITDLYATARKN